MILLCNRVSTVHSANQLQTFAYRNWPTLSLVLWTEYKYHENTYSHERLRDVNAGFGYGLKYFPIGGQ